MNIKHYSVLFIIFLSMSFKLSHARILENKSLVPLSNFSEKIQPTQFHFGEPSVQSRMKKFLLKETLSELNTYLEKKPIPFIKGPNGKKWIIDRHHFSLALERSRDSFKEKGHNLNKIMVAFNEITLKTTTG